MNYLNLSILKAFEGQKEGYAIKIRQNGNYYLMECLIMGISVDVSQAVLKPLQSKFEVMNIKITYNTNKSMLVLITLKNK